MEQNSTQNTAGCAAAGSPSQRHSTVPGCSVTVGGENFSDYSEKSLRLQTNSVAGRWLFCLVVFFFSDFFPFLNVRNSFVRSEFKEFDELSEVFTSKKSAEVCPYPFFPGTYLSPQLSGVKFGKSGTGDKKFKQGLGKEWERLHEIQVFPGFPGETNANGSKFRTCTPENNLLNNFKNNFN